MFENLFGGKSWYQSLTSWGIVVVAVAQTAVAETCAVGLLSAGACAIATKVVTLIGGAMVTLGIRKAATAPNTG